MAPLGGFPPAVSPTRRQVLSPRRSRAVSTATGALEEVCLGQAFGPLWSTRQYWSPTHCVSLGPGFPGSHLPPTLLACSYRLGLEGRRGGPSQAQQPCRRERWVNTGPAARKGRYLKQISSPRCVNLLFVQSQGNVGSSLFHGLAHWNPACCHDPRGIQEPHLATVHTALQVAGAEHGRGDDASVDIPVVADLVGDQRDSCVVQDRGCVTCFKERMETCQEEGGGGPAQNAEGVCWAPGSQEVRGRPPLQWWSWPGPVGGRADEPAVA